MPLRGGVTTWGGLWQLEESPGLVHTPVLVNAAGISALTRGERVWEHRGGTGWGCCSRG